MIVLVDPVLSEKKIAALISRNFFQLFALKKEWRLLPQVSKSSTNPQDDEKNDDEEDPDIAKIKKVQSFFRGWLCRRRWKQIVDEYIRSPHAESMRKRNW